MTLVADNEWYTDPDVIWAAHEVFGGPAARDLVNAVDLDPCSSELANNMVNAKVYFDQDQDGLTTPWFGNVWCNPPWSQAGRWLRKALTSTARTTSRA